MTIKQLVLELQKYDENKEVAFEFTEPYQDDPQTFINFVKEVEESYRSIPYNDIIILK